MVSIPYTIIEIYVMYLLVIYHLRDRMSMSTDSTKTDKVF